MNSAFNICVGEVVKRGSVREERSRDEEKGVKWECLGSRRGEGKRCSDVVYRRSVREER